MNLKQEKRKCLFRIFIPKTKVPGSIELILLLFNSTLLSLLKWRNWSGIRVNWLAENKTIPSGLTPGVLRKASSILLALSSSKLRSSQNRKAVSSSWLCMHRHGETFSAFGHRNVEEFTVELFDGLPPGQLMKASWLRSLSRVLFEHTESFESKSIRLRSSLRIQDRWHGSLSQSILSAI